MDEIEWKAPPANVHAKSERAANDKIADELRAHPGEWACLGRRSTSTASNISNGLVKAYRPAGSFETTQRDLLLNPHNTGRTSIIYARYIGENGEHA